MPAVVEVVVGELQVQSCDHSSPLLLLKSLFCSARTLLLEAPAIPQCLTGPQPIKP